LLFHFLRASKAQLLHNPGLYVRSAICTALFKARRIPCSFVTCEGPLPLVYHRGDFTIAGRLGLGGQLLPCEVGAAVPGAYLHVGHNVYLNNGATVVAYCGIEIGDNTFIGDFVAVYDTNHHSLDGAHPVKSAPVVIGTNVWLGRHVTVLPGSRIGDHTVVSAGSVVRGDLPPRVLAAGNPAKPIRKLDIPEGWLRK
jgi:acetyltransferase-like isoleucine patch superfamily enzyme